MSRLCGDCGALSVQLVAAEKERDEAVACLVRRVLLHGLGLARLTRERDEARASTCYTCRLEWEAARTENASLRAAIAPTVENVEALILACGWKADMRTRQDMAVALTAVAARAGALVK